MSNKRKAVVFTQPMKAEFMEIERPSVGPRDVAVKTQYSAISAGTERACIMNSKNSAKAYPIILGYSSIGEVIEIGSKVTRCKVGDRVLVYHGIHTSVNVEHEDKIFPVIYDELPSLECAFIPIASMSLAGVRKTRIEIGESGMIFGTGILGAFAIQFMKAAGAVPVICAELSKKRRELGLSCGADYAFDPTEEDFAQKVKSLTKGIKTLPTDFGECAPAGYSQAVNEGGVQAIVEVTGAAIALKNALSCVAPCGRISLLGCTRVSDVEIDYYRDIHKPGVELIGAHNFIRPVYDSYPYHWSTTDDYNAIMRMMKNSRVDFSKIITDVFSPTDASEVYNRVMNDKEFPTGAAFDWNGIE